jgi:serine protease AprX
MTTNVRTRALALTAVLSVGAMPALTEGATANPPPPRGTQEVVVHEGGLASSGAVTYAQHSVPATVVPEPVPAEANGRAATQPTQPTRPSRLDPALAAALRAPHAATAQQRVLVTFGEDQRVPVFPDVRRAHSAAADVAAQVRADALVDDLAGRRQAGYTRLRDELAALGIRTLDTFWLIKGAEVDLPLSALPALLQRPDVQFVEPVNTGARPPVDKDPLNDPIVSRGQLRTDPYFNLGQTTGRIGLLDTGVRANHVLLTGPSRLGVRLDLTNATRPNPDDDCWNHGTATAAILTGNNNLGPRLRGITGMVVDSLKVYPSRCGFLDAAAAVRGFQRAVQILDRVIVAEMQPRGTEFSAISTAADAAFDAGAVVVAANGNNGCAAGTVNVPASAQKVLGVGAVDVKTLRTPCFQSRGPTLDGRVKPDLQAPTNVETASTASTRASQVFSGTSAATPHAAGAAALVRNFLRGPSPAIDPGQVYAYLLAVGTAPTPLSNVTGAGLVKLPSNGHFWRGTTVVSTGHTVEIPIAVPATKQAMNVALWWPERPANHNDVNLSLVDPRGVTRGSSRSVDSVFEKVSVRGPTAGGTWRLRVSGFRVPSRTQRVSWTATTMS